MPRRALPLVLVLALAWVGRSQSGGGSAVCAACHAAIYQSYQRTPMARSARKLDPSTAPERFEKATFTHRPSDYHYRVSLTKAGYTLEFAKDGLTASKVLAYAVGSGTRAYSYLIGEDGFLYEAPVAYYAAGNAWGLAPGYDGYSYPYLTRPIAPGCLSCHASSVQAAADDPESVPFAGVSRRWSELRALSRDGAKHVANMKRADILESGRHDARSPRLDLRPMSSDGRRSRHASRQRLAQLPPRRQVERFPNGLRPGLGRRWNEGDWPRGKPRFEHV